MAAPPVAPDAPKASKRSIRVVVDPRVELVSTIFRLAGNPEYNRGRVDAYTRDVEQHFGPLRNHPVVQLARQLRRTRGVSYDACMSLAVLLADPYELATKLPIHPLPDCLDRRWTDEGVRQFLDAAKLFVKEANFRKFIDDHRALYEVAEARMQVVLEEAAHLEWFDEFFGARPAAEFTVVLGLLNGGGCYGPRVLAKDRPEELYCILGVWRTDAAGQPAFDRTMLATVVHEFCHSYANAIIDRHAAELRAAAETIYPHVAATMRSQAYGDWKTMLYESLVRACVIRYALRYDGPEAARRAIQEEQRRGFAWMNDLVNLLGEYEKQRGRYRDLNAFAPRIIAFFAAYAPPFAWEQAALAAARPKILSLTPADGARDVDPATARIEVIFDRPMQDQSWSMVGGGPHFPTLAGKPAYDPKRTTWSVAVTLKPDWDYEFMLNSDRFAAFRSAAGVPLTPVRVRFRTASKPR